MWYLTDLAVKMGQSLGLHQDQDQDETKVSVFDMQKRRRLWWQILLIDCRAT